MNSEYLISDLLEIGTANQQILLAGKCGEVVEEAGFLQCIEDDLISDLLEIGAANQQILFPA